MSVSDSIFLFLFVLLGCWAAVAFYARQRGLDFEPDPNRDNVFSCEECEYVYTDDDDVERSRCPECGVMNGPVVF